IFTLAVTVGYGSLYLLPRMGELKKGRSDPAIRGRIEAWQFGLDTMKTTPRGVGLGNFTERFYAKHHYVKAGHSSYVQIATEMGRVGFFIFFAILYSNLRVLITAKTTSTEEERIRRMLFV